MRPRNFTALAAVVACVSALGPAALRAQVPIDITSFEPAEISFLGKTPFEIRGRGFFDRVTVKIGGKTAALTEVRSDRITGIAPSQPADANPLPVTVDGGLANSDTLDDAVTYVGPFRIDAVSPSTLPENVGGQILVRGLAFTPKTGVKIGGAPLAAGAIVFVDARTLKVQAPGLKAGAYDVAVTDVAGDLVPVPIEKSVAGALTYEAATPPELSTVDPPVVCAGGGTTVVIRGSSFLPDTVIRFGSRELVERIVHEDGTTITGKAPAIGSTEPEGGVTVTAVDWRGQVSKRDLVSYTRDCEALPAPQQFETSLAEGTARFAWFNPVPYAAIEVRSADGALLRRLPGNTTFLELDALGDTEVAISVQGVAETGKLTASTDAIARVHHCEYPPPLGGSVKPGEMDLTIYGGHEEAHPARCADGGGASLDDGPVVHVPQDPDGIGYVIPNWAKNLLGEESKLATGFHLSQDADRLEISGYYQKLATDFGLALRGRLVHVFPDDGFEDEFSFPDPFIGDSKKFHSLTYFRADRDVSDPEAQPCLGPDGKIRRIPAGDYRLEIYAVGGNRKLPYYVFADDPRDSEILIEGVPCPPYPLVRVRNLTGFRTLPNISRIVLDGAQELSEPFDLGVYASFSARGTWLDEDGKQWSIDQLCDNAQAVPKPGGGFQFICKDPPYQANADFEYCWGIRVTEPAVCIVDGPAHNRYLPDWGCYQFELTVRDKACGVSRTFYKEVALLPNRRDICTPGNDHFSFLYPTPDPSSVFGIGSLASPAPGFGSFKGQRPIEFRVLVAPKCYCENKPADECPAALVFDDPASSPPDLSDARDDVQFRLAVQRFVSFNPPKVEYHDLNARLRVLDLCPNVADGPKYYLVFMEDLGELPWSQHLDGYDFRAVFLQGRTNCERKVVNGTTICDTNVDHKWFNVGKPMRLANHPPSLDVSFWEGSFDPADASYHFAVKSSQSTEQRFEMPDSEAIPFDIVDAGIPAYKGNNLGAGFTSRFMMQGGEWLPETGAGTSSGSLLENQLQGSPHNVGPVVVAGDGGGAAFEPPSYHWCDYKTIFKNKFSQDLFQALIYAGFIGPVPVNIWGKVGLGLAFEIGSYVDVRVSPFKALEGPDANFVETSFYLISKAVISIPCSISADILGGIASVVLRLVPEAGLEVGPYIKANLSLSGPELEADYYLDNYLNISMEAEACVQTVVFGEQCLPPITIPLVENERFLPTRNLDDKPDPDACNAGAGFEAEAAIAAGDGGGAGAVVIRSWELANVPISITSPDGKVVVDAWASSEVTGKLLRLRITEGDQVTDLEAFHPGLGWFYLDPSASFVSNTEVLFAGTSPPGNFLPQVPPDDPSHPEYLSARNHNIAHTEIQVARLRKENGIWKMNLQNPVHVSDADAAPAMHRRADGKASLAGDLSSGDALVAWVRYTDEFLIQEGLKTVLLPGCIPQGGIERPVCSQTVPNIRPKLEATSIVVRRVDALGPIGGDVPVALSTPGINVQPSIALAPSGEAGYCVWVHDPTHHDLISSNRGRFLKYAVYAKASDSWSAPADALALPGDFPGLMEPVIALRDEDNGILAFTSLKAGASEDDTGLGGGSRFVYACRLVNGVFQEPVLIHGECGRREYGFGQSLAINVPLLIDPESKLHTKLPEWVMTFQEYGQPGLVEGSGNINVTFLNHGANEWTAPVRLLPKGQITTNIAATVLGGKLHTLHFDGGPALFNPALGAGAGVAAGYLSLDTALEPDLAIVRCDLSDAFPAPGSKITAKVEIKNLGFASSPTDARGASAIGLQAVFTDTKGLERIVQRQPLAELQPSESHVVELQLEMPHEPVRLSVRIDPNPIDRNRDNDREDCFFGAPAPEDFECAVSERVAEDGSAALAVLLSWSNPAIYDGIWLYRDGSMVAALPGASTRFSESGVKAGEHVYEVRGIIGASKSTKAGAVCRVEPPPAASFLRGNANHDLQLDISDATYMLNFLFLGGSEPKCAAAADGNGDGGIEISDVSFVLNFLFLGGPQPPAPYPACGPASRESDLKLGCEEPGC